jgi:hypothetical protein
MRAGIQVMAATLMVLCSPLLAVACSSGAGRSCGGSSHGSSCDSSAPAVRWCSKPPAELQAGASEPFAIYFCTEGAAKYAGEGADVVSQCRRTNPSCKTTIWESSSVLKDLHSAGITICAKVAATKENQELFRKYGVGANTLVLCAPNGDALVTLAGDQCSAGNVSRELRCFKEKLDAWKRSQK